MLWGFFGFYKIHIDYAFVTIVDTGIKYHPKIGIFKFCQHCNSICKKCVPNSFPIFLCYWRIIVNVFKVKSRLKSTAVFPMKHEFLYNTVAIKGLII